MSKKRWKGFFLILLTYLFIVAFFLFLSFVAQNARNVGIQDLEKTYLSSLSEKEARLFNNLKKSENKDLLLSINNDRSETFLILCIRFFGEDSLAKSKAISILKNKTISPEVRDWLKDYSFD